MLGLVQIRHSGNVINKDIIIKLSDIAGSAKFIVKDRDGTPVFSVDSKGNLKFRGTQGKI